MEPMVFEYLSYPVVCQDCGAETECSGVHALVDDSLTWDTEINCSACGLRQSACGGELPAGLRDRMLSEHGPVRLRLDPATGNAVAMRVLRAELGLALAEARSVLNEVVTGEYVGTMPEMERLARRLRAAGIEAVAARA
ncbi:hypothetical protein ACWCPT_06070 [Streptomyces sp. NPDC002308]